MHKQLNLKSLLQERYLRDEISDSICHGFLWGVVWGCLNTQNKLVLQWMGYFVTSKENLWVLQELPGGKQRDNAFKSYSFKVPKDLCTNLALRSSIGKFLDCTCHDFPCFLKICTGH